eukprot:1159775-Pelagomonas_calceolata.AAC.3
MQGPGCEKGDHVHKASQVQVRMYAKQEVSHALHTAAEAHEQARQHVLRTALNARMQARQQNYNTCAKAFRLQMSMHAMQQPFVSSIQSPRTKRAREAASFKHPGTPPRLHVRIHARQEASESSTGEK